MSTQLEEVAVRASGVLAEFNARGVLSVADVNVALTLSRLCGETDPDVQLALALTVRALRGGSVCVRLGTVDAEVFELDETTVESASLPWPEPDGWLEKLRRSPVVRYREPSAEGPVPGEPRPLLLHGDLLYLDRYFAHEESVRAQLVRRREVTPPAVDPAALAGLLDRLFDRDGLAPAEPNWQRVAAASCVLHWVSVIAGGPGTGKTTTVAKVLATLQALHGGRLRIMLAAPTGKAAARLEEAVRTESARLPADLAAPVADLRAATLHRVLGWRPDSRTRFRHDAGHPLPWDVVVLDEMSMVSLPMMARLLEATRSGTRVVLVGDPDQLTSVEAGAVMADVTGAAAAAPALAPDDPRLTTLDRSRADDRAGDGRALPAEVELAPVARGVVQLRHTWRFGAEIGALADALRAGRADDAVDVLRAGGQHLSWVQTDLTAAGGGHGEPPAELDPLQQAVLRSGRAVDAAARAGRAAEAVEALEQHRVLCAHRGGPFGVARWSRLVEGWLSEAVPGYGEGGEWYLGRPLLVTANDPDIGLYNGDTGVVVSTGRGLQAAFSRGREPVLHPLIHLDAVQSVHAMTVHKAQGSQFAQVTFVLPPLDSALLTRELLYTAVTRARDRVEIIGTEDALRRAVERPAQRASGLRHRL